MNFEMMIPNEFKIDGLEVVEDRGDVFLLSCLIDGEERKVHVKRKGKVYIENILRNKYEIDDKELSFVHVSKVESLRSSIRIKLMQKNF